MSALTNTLTVSSGYGSCVISNTSIARSWPGTLQIALSNPSVMNAVPLLGSVNPMLKNEPSGMFWFGPVGDSAGPTADCGSDRCGGTVAHVVMSGGMNAHPWLLALT